jgi:gliding motility-associated-like protein
LGGSGDDAAYVLAIGNNNDIFVGGGTASANFPGNKLNTVGPTFNGGIADGFIAEVGSLGNTLVRSTFIGTPGGDQIYGVQFDVNGFLYLMGTSNNGNFPVRNAAFSQPGGKQFIAKLQPDLSQYVYSTVFGTNTGAPNISPTAFLVDRCENVYVSGWGGATPAGQGLPAFPSAGTANLTTTADAVQRQTDGKDFYFFVLEKDATSQLFGSFFGQLNRPDEFGDHVDGGTSRFDGAGVIYQGICANCGGGQFPTTPGVVGPSNPSGRCNQAVLKVSFDLSGVRGGVKSAIDNVDGDTAACVPAMVQFRDTVGIARTFEWNFGDGNSTITTSANVSHVFANVGTYRVRLIAVDSSKCFPRDTSFVTIRIREDSAIVAASATKLNPCEANSYRFDNLSVAIPSKPFSSSSFTWQFGDNSPQLITGTGPVIHQYAAPGTYNVRLILTDTNYCNSPDTFIIPLRVSPLVDALFNTPASGCAPYDAAFINESLGGQQFFWDFGDGSTSTAVNPVKRYTLPGTYTIKLVAIDSSTCNIIDSVQRTIIVSDKPNADFSFSPNPPEENIITTFNNLSDVVPLYKWLFGDGDSLFTTRRDTLVRHQYNETGTYNACIIAINQFGCPDTLCRPIPAVVSPLVNVVSAFTPNGDGVNDRAVVFGFGIQKLNFRIYNRWGQLMYETATKNTGWDGRFKGKDQPMDAYGYSLEAELVSGEKVKMSGSITLIR